MGIGKVTVGRVGRGSGICVRVDRKSVLGNPYCMRDEAQRDAVCDLYATHFAQAMRSDQAMRAEVWRIMQLVMAGNDVTLQCWCAPKRCHADTIKHFIEYTIPLL